MAIKLNVSYPEKPDASKGGGGWPLYLETIEQFAWHDSLFTRDELNTIIEIGNSTTLNKATTYGGSDESVRNSTTSFLFPNEVTGWIYERLAALVINMNDRFFGFDLFTMEQGLQFTRYTAPGQHYAWHQDHGPNSSTRKLSLSVQLNDPSEYKGGEFQMLVSAKPIKIKRQLGFVTLFPSYTLHRVTPVKEGTRYSLVCWVSGPPFR